jgi:hypothetical protein
MVHPIFKTSSDNVTNADLLVKTVHENNIASEDKKNSECIACTVNLKANDQLSS